MASNLIINWSGTTTGNSVTNYTLVYYSALTSPQIISNISSGTTSYTLTGLNENVSYSGYVYANCSSCYSSNTLNWSVPQLGCQSTIINFTGQTGMTISLGAKPGSNLWSILEVSGSTINPSNSACTRFDIYYPTYDPSNPSLNKITNIGNNGHPLYNDGIYYVYFSYVYDGINRSVFVKYNSYPDGCTP